MTTAPDIAKTPVIEQATLDEDSPVFEAPDGADGATPEPGGMMTLEGIATLDAENSYNAIKELLHLDGSLMDMLPKANLTQEQADLIRGLVAEDMIHRYGTIQTEKLLQLELALSVAIGGRGREDAVRMTGGGNVMAALQAGAQKVGNAAQSAWQRARRNF